MACMLGGARKRSRCLELRDKDAYRLIEETVHEVERLHGIQSVLPAPIRQRIADKVLTLVLGIELKDLDI